MFHLNGFQENLKTLVLLSAPHLPPGAGPGRLKEAYQDFLSTIQPEVPRSQAPGIAFAQDERKARELVRFFQVESTANDLEQDRAIETRECSPRERGEAYQGFEAAFERIEKREAGLASLALLAVNHLFYCPSERAGGGSTSSAIGVIWANPRPNWGLQDYEEFLVHELTHQLVFLDEFRFRHYADYRKVSDPRCFAQSAILRIPRPVDKVFHSLIVALEVLLHRDRVSGNPPSPKLHPLSPQMQAQAGAAIESLRSLDRREAILTARGREMLEKCALALALLQAAETRRHA